MTCICKKPVTSTIQWKTIVENLEHCKDNMYKCSSCGAYHKINFRSGPKAPKPPANTEQILCTTQRGYADSLAKDLLATERISTAIRHKPRNGTMYHYIHCELKDFERAMAFKHGWLCGKIQERNSLGKE